MAPPPSRARRSRPLWHYALVSLLALLIILALGHLGQRSGMVPHFHEQTEHGPQMPSADSNEQPVSIATGEKQGNSTSQIPDHHNDLPAVPMSEGELFGGELVHMPRRELISLTTTSGNYSKIVFPNRNAYSPNIIPHPTRKNWYIAIAQRAQGPDGPEEMLCEAEFRDDDFLCSDTPSKLQTAESIFGQCPDTFALLNGAPGPRDARIAFSPKVPYLVYGSLSHYACLGLWVQDLRVMVDALDQLPEDGASSVWYKQATEIRRPEPFGVVEKNFFLFWDTDNNTYVQTDVTPKRVLAKLDSKGYVAENLTSSVESADRQCIEQHMPVAKKGLGGFDHESVHLATNSLRITTCKRADVSCKPDDSNTFIMHVIHHVYGYSLHTVYEPYLVLFRQNAPFTLHAVAKKAFWIRGREIPQSEDRKHQDAFQSIPHGQSEMFYVTSMSWKNQGQNYHGYADDPLFLAFGIEDQEAGAIDVLAGDLLQDLALC